MNYQKIILVGFVTRDAQKRTSKKGNINYATFSIAVNDGKENATFFPVVAFDKLGTMATIYVKKGRQLLAEGRIETTDNGRFNVVADRIFLGAQAGKPAEKTKKVEEKK